MKFKDTQFLCSAEIKISKYYTCFPFSLLFTVNPLYNFHFVLIQIFHMKIGLHASNFKGCMLGGCPNHVCP